jgi:hypothetical protein
MTVREVVEHVGLDDPLTALTAALLVMRTAVQGEAATVEGVWASVVAFERRYGRVSAATVGKWLDELGWRADHDIPRLVIEAVVLAGD